MLLNHCTMDPNPERRSQNTLWSAAALLPQLQLNVTPLSKTHPPDLFTLQAFQVEIKTRLCQWLEVGGKTSQNNSVERLPPISLELAPKKVKSNNRGFGVYQLAQPGGDPLHCFQLALATTAWFHILGFLKTHFYKTISTPMLMIIFIEDHLEKFCILSSK